MLGKLTISSIMNALRSDLRWRVFIFVLVIAYCYAMHKLIGLRPDHFFLSLIVLVFLIFGKEWGIRFLIDWSPFIIFWIAYDMMRGIADSVRGYVFVIEPYVLEMRLFGWLTGQMIPPYYMRQFQLGHQGEPFKVFLDVFSTSFYVLHFITPLLLGWFLWHTLNERRNYYLYVYSFTVLNIMALITFMVLPAAPPWYVLKYGFQQPPSQVLGSAGALVNFDKLIGKDYLESLWNTFNSNLFAAIPSLHAGYPTLIALFIWLRFGGLTLLFFAYPLCAWFSAVYLNQHYIIDLIIGSLYVVIAYFIAKKLIMPNIFDKLINYDKKPRSGAPGK